MNIKIYIDGDLVEYNSFVFSAGEVSVKLKLLPKHAYPNALGGTKIVKLVARLQNSNDIMSLFMIKNAIENYFLNKEYSANNIVYELVLPYLPFSRQDRICDEGESFSLKVFGDMINTLNFSKVTTYDAHSEVSLAVIKNLVNIPQTTIVAADGELFNLLGRSVLISPDVGANKKVAKLAAFLGHKEFVRADKLRDLTNGKIKESILYCDDFKGRDVALVDDLVERGGTFIPLVKMAKERNCGLFSLICVQGILPIGVQHLFEAGIDRIFVANTFKETYDFSDERFKVINIVK